MSFVRGTTRPAGRSVAASVAAVSDLRPTGGSSSYSAAGAQSAAPTSDGTTTSVTTPEEAR